jgi:uncharacterized protein YhfF
MTRRIDSELLASFLRQAGLDRRDDVDVRRIGTDDAMVQAIIDRIATGEKSMTYSLPWIAERENRTAPIAGRYLVVLNASGNPALLLRLTEIRNLLFGEVSEKDLEREGIPMRSLSAWRPLHIAVWNEKLAPFGLSVSDDMPVWAESFDLIYPSIE